MIETSLVLALMSAILPAAPRMFDGPAIAKAIAQAVSEEQSSVLDSRELDAAALILVWSDNRKAWWRKDR